MSQKPFDCLAEVLSTELRRYIDSLCDSSCSFIFQVFKLHIDAKSGGKVGRDSGWLSGNGQLVER